MFKNIQFGDQNAAWNKSHANLHDYSNQNMSYFGTKSSITPKSSMNKGEKKIKYLDTSVS